MTGAGLAVAPTTTSADAELLGEALPGHGTAADSALRAPRRARAFGWRFADRVTPASAGVAREERSRLAGAEHQDGALGQIAEDLRRELEADRGNRERMHADLRLGPHALARGHGPLEEAVQHGPRRARLPREPERLAHLPEHLALAESHRVEARCHAEEVPRRVVADPVEPALRRARRDPARATPTRSASARPRVGLLRHAVDLAAMAGRDDDAFRDDAAAHEAVRPSRISSAVNATRSRTASPAVRKFQPRTSEARVRRGASSEGVRPRKVEVDDGVRKDHEAEPDDREQGDALPLPAAAVHPEEEPVHEKREDGPAELRVPEPVPEPRRPDRSEEHRDDERPRVRSRRPCGSCSRSTSRDGRREKSRPVRARRICRLWIR